MGRRRRVYMKIAATLHLVKRRRSVGSVLMMTDEVIDDEPGMPGRSSSAPDAGQARVDGAFEHRDRAAAPHTMAPSVASKLSCNIGRVRRAAPDDVDVP